MYFGTRNGFGTRGTTNGCSGKRKSKRQTEMGPYGGISNPVAIEPLPHRRSHVSSPVPPEPGHPSMNKKAEWNEKTFPWTGDITDLRDPQVARLEQAFTNYPLWTIQKVIFVCSMVTAARGRSPLVRNSARDTAVPLSSMKDSKMKPPVAVPDHLSTSESPFILSNAPNVDPRRMRRFRWASSTSSLGSAPSSSAGLAPRARIGRAGELRVA